MINSIVAFFHHQWNLYAWIRPHFIPFVGLLSLLLWWFALKLSIVRLLIRAYLFIHLVIERMAELYFFTYNFTYTKCLLKEPDFAGWRGGEGRLFQRGLLLVISKHLNGTKSIDMLAFPSNFGLSSIYQKITEAHIKETEFVVLLTEDP